MTLEDISILFGDPVELSFEQALSKQEHRDEVYDGASEGKERMPEKVEDVPNDR